MREASGDFGEMQHWKAHNVNPLLSRAHFPSLSRSGPAHAWTSKTLIAMAASVIVVLCAHPRDDVAHADESDQKISPKNFHGKVIFPHTASITPIIDR
jgi:hypothetical protein